jgi:hypothetical protein
LVDLSAHDLERLIVLGTAALTWLWYFHLKTRCAHPWELVDKTEIESRLETILKTSGRLAYTFPSEIAQLAYKRVILAMRCPKCGMAKIHKIDSA